MLGDLRWRVAVGWMELRGRDKDTKGLVVSRAWPVQVLRRCEADDGVLSHRAGG